MNNIVGEFQGYTGEQSITNGFHLPNKKWFKLKEACSLKGIVYQTALNKRWLQPNGGVEESIIAGRKVWSYETINRWITMSDSEIDHRCAS